MFEVEAWWGRLQPAEGFSPTRFSTELGMALRAAEGDEKLWTIALIAPAC
jgi:hypothetical protein